MAVALPILACADAENVGAQLYASHCGGCHDTRVLGAPSRQSLRELGKSAIYEAITSGPMVGQAAGLADRERRSIADFLGGHSHAEAYAPFMCPARTADLGPIERNDLDGWGFTTENTRYVSPSIGQISRREIPALKVKWAFAYPGATRARAQPNVVGNTVLVGSQDGTIHALSLGSGCTYWTYKANAEVRTAISVASERIGAHDRWLAYFGDLSGSVYALDAETGHLLWRRKVDAHPAVAISGSPKLYARVIFVPMSSMEWAAAADSNYACCSFRGGVVALDAVNGKQLWKTYSIDAAPRKTGKLNSAGAALQGPAGAPIWNTPTIDVRRHRLYVGTGQSYTWPAAPTSDSVLALDMSTGARIWSFQALADDAWNLSCYGGDRVNCPKNPGPDQDFGAAIVLVDKGGKGDLVVAGQKTGYVYALNPDSGAVVWKTKVGRGGYAGGVHFGMATDGTRILVPINDRNFALGKLTGRRFPGVHALAVDTGQELWYTAANACAARTLPNCQEGNSAPITASEEFAVAGAVDGFLRVYDMQSGRILWQFDTTATVLSVSGQPAHGGSMDGSGPIVVRGNLLVNSGYLYFGGMGGNVLLCFSAAD